MRTDAFLTLEGAVSLYRVKWSIIFDQIVKDTCSVELYVQVSACIKEFILCNRDFYVLQMMPEMRLLELLIRFLYQLRF